MPASTEPSRPLALRPAWQRALWFGAGGLALLLGLLGIVLPILPTTPFVLLAAFCFSRGSRRCEIWLLAHPRLGPMIRQWRDHGAVPRRAKWLALAMMAVSCAVAIIWLGWPMGYLPLLPCGIVGTWLWLRPEPGKVSGSAA